VNDQPKITVGILDRRKEICGYLHGDFFLAGFGSVSGRFSIRAEEKRVLFCDERGREILRSSRIELSPVEDSAFTLFNVTIGDRFHWKREEDQVFRGSLIFQGREDETLAAINEIGIEDYLTGVISSEMSEEAPFEFLKAHAILSRSWVLASLGKRAKGPPKPSVHEEVTQEEVIRWYDREEHDLYQVCADDHCQRYHGVGKSVSGRAREAVQATFGRVVTYQGEICDARYSKACGGRTELFRTAWEDREVSYLQSVSDGPIHDGPIWTEEDASRFVCSSPQAHCNTHDEGLLKRILSKSDLETGDFFRWRVEYGREEMEEILWKKSGFDFGTLKEIVPLQRGPSGRISRLKIVGSKKSVVVGKELEIRRWLSRSHLYSSAFVVETKRDIRGIPERFLFRGAGWGHGVGLCQIGAAVMATRGFSAEGILSHYFRGTTIERIY